MSSHYDTYNYKCLYVAPTFHGCLVQGFAPARYYAVQNHKKLALLRSPARAVAVCTPDFGKKNT